MSSCIVGPLNRSKVKSAVRLTAFGTSRALASGVESKPEAAKATIEKEDGRIIENERGGERDSRLTQGVGVSEDLEPTKLIGI